MARALTLLMVSLLVARATFAQTAIPTEDSIREVLNRVHGYLLTATPLRPINGDTGAAGGATDYSGEACAVIALLPALLTRRKAPNPGPESS